MSAISVGIGGDMNFHFSPEFLPAHLGLCIPDGLVLVESGLSGFAEESGEALSFPFSTLESVPSEARTVVFDLPYQELVSGVGRGYLLELQENVSEVLDMPYFSALRISYPSWGVPVMEVRLFFVASITQIPKVTPQPPTHLREVLPLIMFHAMSPRKRPLMNAGMHTLYGYVPSDKHALPPISNWGGKYPVTEVRDRDSLRVSRMTHEDIQVLWGCSFSPSIDLLRRLTPTLVINSVLGAVALNCKNI